MSFEHAKQPQNHNSPHQNTQAYGKPSESHSNWVMAVDIKCLGGPEEENREEVGARDEGDDKRQSKDPWVLLEAGGKHGVSGTFDLPDHKRDDEKRSEEEWYEYVCGLPCVLFQPQLTSASSTPSQLT